MQSRHGGEGRRRPTRLAGGLALVVLVIAIVPGCGSETPERSIVGYPTVDGNPAIELSDGRVYQLQKIDETAAIVARFPAPDEEPPPSLERRFPAGLPPRADLRANQVSKNRRFDTIEDQSARNTCVAHATVAALEAAYQRERGLTLDLSEQYANHIQKSVWLSTLATGPTERETQAGAWGGSGIGYQLGWLYRLRFGLPDQAAASPALADLLEYVPHKMYERTNEEGDIPRLSGALDNQRMIDGWNLSSNSVVYSIPSVFRATNLPRSGLQAAVYGASRVRAVALNLDGLRAELAEGREVAIGMTLTRPAAGSDAVPFEDDMWIPLSDADGGEVWGAHAMLIVGYDDDRQAFIVKNSWGRDADGRGGPAGADLDADGYIEIAYGWMPYIYEAYSVLETRDPNTFNNQQAWLGFWKTQIDGVFASADLAIYHLPGAFPGDALLGQTDRRLGTLYTDDDVFRVNGTVYRDREMTGYFGTSATDTRYDAASDGDLIEAFLFDDVLAGWLHDRDDFDIKYPLLATTRTSLPLTTPAREVGTTTTAADYLGEWTFHDGDRVGTLRLVGLAGDEVTGSFSTSGEEVNAILTATDPCRFRLEIGPVGTAQTYLGGLFCDPQGQRPRALLSGTFATETARGGFYAYRTRNAGIRIISPTDHASLARGANRVDFIASVSSDATVVWTSNLDGVIGTGHEFSRFDLSYGEHTITATATHVNGQTTTDTVQLVITNQAPTVALVAPTSTDGPFCTGEEISFQATVTDLNEWPTYTLGDSSVTWKTSAGTDLGTGKTLSHTFATAGGYTVIARATDSEGLYVEDDVTITVEDCPDSPPVVAITTPAQDTATDDDAYTYDGYDAAKSMWYADIAVVGTASDPEDGALSGAQVKWSTNRSDLQPTDLGTGTSRSIRLYSNVCGGVWHQVRFTATDTDGNVRSALRRIYIWTLC